MATERFKQAQFIMIMMLAINIAGSIGGLVNSQWLAELLIFTPETPERYHSSFDDDPMFADIEPLTQEPPPDDPTIKIIFIVVFAINIAVQVFGLLGAIIKNKNLIIWYCIIMGIGMLCLPIPILAQGN